MHTEFDGKGNAYTSFFISSEVVKWDLKTKEVLDRVPSYYSIGHLMIPGGDSKKPWGKYLVSLNKITKDRYLPTGPELAHSAQLYDISGDKMKLLLDFPTMGEPHYAQAIPADIIKDKQVKYFRLEDNKRPHATKKAADGRIDNLATLNAMCGTDNLEQAIAAILKGGCHSKTNGNHVKGFAVQRL